MTWNARGLAPYAARDDAFGTMRGWRYRLFAWMLRHEVSEADAMGIPVDRVVIIEVPADVGDRP